MSINAPDPGQPTSSRSTGCSTRLDHFHSITPLIQYAPFQRWDTLPFLILYGVLMLIDSGTLLKIFDSVDSGDENAMETDILVALAVMQRWVHAVVFPIVFLAHLALVLACQWNVSVEAFVGYRKLNMTSDLQLLGADDQKKAQGHMFQWIGPSTEKWTHCLVSPPGAGTASSSRAQTEAELANGKKANTQTQKKKLDGQKKSSKANVNPNVGRMEIVPIQFHTAKATVRNDDQKGTAENENSDALRVLTINYEETIFRCCISSSIDTKKQRSCEMMEPGYDPDMDSIWNVHKVTTTNNNKSDGPNGMVRGSCKSDGDGDSLAPQANVMQRQHNHDEGQKKMCTIDVSATAAPTTIFHKLQYPINQPLSFYTNHWHGHIMDTVSSKSTISTLQDAKDIYSNNRLIITITPFTELLSQQLIAPFFLFQLFCVLLWSLDEYWYYALFTLFTLILFESTVAFTRRKNLQRLRETLRPGFMVWVWRGGHNRTGMWKVCETGELVVGDMISLTSVDASSSGLLSASGQHKDGHKDGGSYVPADILLLNGGAVVNEAMLTGESVPQIKEAIDIVATASTSSPLSSSGHNQEPNLDFEDADYKRAILFGGTLLVNHTPASENDPLSSTSSSSNKPSMPPDGGCLGIVLRTGFETQQGSLLRTMVHTSTKSSQNSSGVNTKDTFLFILILLLCAIGSSTLVLQHGWNDPTRNRFKLVLHVIIIITSVVPPELPMELSLAVTSSLADLIKRCAVYCTEPFRIPLAGMVDTCAFDKTGTLTSDEMVLRGVRLPLAHEWKGMDIRADISEKLIFPKLHDDNDDEEESSEVKKESISNEILRVMVGCQSLAKLSTTHQPSASDNIIGDPLEKAVLMGCQWNLHSDSIVAPPKNRDSKPIQILHRFAFTSKLKRMSVLASDVGSRDVWILTKGAPEILKTLMEPSSVPDSYDEVSRYHMSLGQRVLAMGYRRIDLNAGRMTLGKIKQRGREAVECNLTFAGFLVLDCPLKPDTKAVISELRSSGHDTVMITGDAVLTAAEVARQVGIIDSKKGGETYELRELKDRNLSKDASTETRFEFVPIGHNETDDLDTEKCIAYSQSNLNVVKEMLVSSQIRAICVTGDVLTKLSMEAVRRQAKKNGLQSSVVDPKTVLLHPDAKATLESLVPIVSVFARHAPRQKEAVIAAFNGAGRVTLMCGDGTNDVGALKMSHIGISIISVPDLEAKQRHAVNGVEKVVKEERQERKMKNSRKSNDASQKKKTRNRRRKRAIEEHLQALAETEEELSNVALGDASVASPFTSRSTSIKCTKDVLQRGRCTLVTMQQIYKILGVNSLVNALVLSSLHIAGVKQGDRQLTAVGLVVSALFFFVTKGQPIETLSPQRPPHTVLCKQVLLSIALQFCIHLSCILAVTALSQLYLDPYDPSLVPDGHFNPNTLNTATFLMTVLATVNTFLVNYRGRPFVEDLRENKMLVQSLKFCYGTLCVCALEVFPPLNELLQLETLPSGNNSMEHLDMESIHANPHLLLSKTVIELIGFKAALCFLMIIDTVTAYCAESMLTKLFERSEKKMKEKKE